MRKKILPPTHKLLTAGRDVRDGGGGGGGGGISSFSLFRVCI